MDILSVKDLNSKLDTYTLGRHAVLLDTVDSTNTEARRMLEKGCVDGAVIIAARQTGGKGRRGRHWVSEAGCGLWMTAVVKPFMALEEMQKLTLLAAVAVCRAVEHVASGTVKPVIKWPNDVLVMGRKLCGILCESAMDGAGERWVIIGIGVNTKTPEAGYGEATGAAIALEQAAGKPINRVELAAAILNDMEALFTGWRSQGFSAIAAGYREYMLPAGCEVVVIDGDKRRQGRIEGLDDGGGLLVRLDTGEIEHIISGEITVRGVAGHV